MTKGISYKDTIQACRDTSGKNQHTLFPAFNLANFPSLAHPSVSAETKIQDLVKKEVDLLKEKIDQFTMLVTFLCSLIASSVKLSESSKTELQKILSSLVKFESPISEKETDSEDGMDEDDFIAKRIVSSFPGKRVSNKRVHKQKTQE